MEENPDFALQKLIFAYARAAERTVFAVAFGFDSLCAQIVDSTSETLIGQMRLAWWRDVMAKAPAERPQGHPFIALLSELPDSSSSAHLVDLVNCWEEFLVAEDRAAASEALCDARAKAIARMIVGHVAAASTDDFKPKLAVYTRWQLLRRTGLVKDAEQCAAAWDRLQALTSQNPGMQKTVPKPVRLLFHLIKNDSLPANRAKPFFRPATALRIIGYGLTR